MKMQHVYIYDTRIGKEASVAKKITLTVPESLSRKIDQWRSSFNMSKLFQDAMDEAIKKKEELQRLITKDHSIDEIVERLKTEKRDLEGEISERGRADGFAWAKSAHYRELRAVLSSGEPLGSEEEPQESSAQGAAAQGWTSYKDELGSPGDAETTRQHRELYRAGWQNGVWQLWNLVKDRLDDQ